MAAEAGKWHKDWARSKREFKKKTKGLVLDEQLKKLLDKQDRFAPEIKKADMMIIRYSMAKKSIKPKFLKPFTKLVKATGRSHKKYFLDLKASYKTAENRSKIEALARPLLQDSIICLAQAQDQITRIKQECDAQGSGNKKLAKNVESIKKQIPKNLTKATGWVEKRVRDKDAGIYEREFAKTTDLIRTPVQELLTALKKAKKKADGKKIKTELARFENWCKGAKLPDRNPEQAIAKLLKDFNKKARRVLAEVDKIST